MAIEFPPLPFELGALEPYISQKTLEFHWGKHHRNYVKTLNDLIQGTPLEKMNLEEIMQASHGTKAKIYNNAGQAWNHDFMWHCLGAPNAKPSKNLESAIAKDFGSFDDFKEKFTTAAKDLFGAGWAWLVKDRSGILQIRSLPNAENPMIEGEVPLLTCDVWEHAYYLDYQNERPKYLQNYWSVIDWEFIEKNLEKQIDSMGKMKAGKTDTASPNVRH